MDVMGGRRGRQTPSREEVDMTFWPAADALNRTAKQLIDSGEAANPKEAMAILQGYVLQLDVGPGLAVDGAGQAAVLTTINAASRAFLGGVQVCIEDNPLLTEGWGAGCRLTSAIANMGARLVDRLDDNNPTIVVGCPTRASIGKVVVHLTWSGWSAGLVVDPSSRLDERGISLAGVLAGGLGVSECFQHRRGSPVAARRDVGISLWRPDLDWRSKDAAGPALRYLPSGVWLLGLGHLGQAYAWSLGLLPYAAPSDVNIGLVDTDIVVEANLSTGLLTRPEAIDARKTRLVASRLEQIGLTTTVVERLFDKTMRPTLREPSIAIAGFDDPGPRRLLGGHFDRVVDGGLGNGAVGYLDLVLHTFPSSLDPATLFVDHPEQSTTIPAPYEAQIEHLVGDGIALGDATCGMTQMAGISVGASFVGATAGALAVGDLLRFFQHGPAYSIVSLDLRNPLALDAVTNSAPGPCMNPGFTRARE